MYRVDSILLNDSFPYRFCVFKSRLYKHCLSSIPESDSFILMASKFARLYFKINDHAWLYVQSTGVSHWLTRRYESMNKFQIDAYRYYINIEKINSITQLVTACLKY